MMPLTHNLHGTGHLTRSTPCSVSVVAFRVRCGERGQGEKSALAEISQEYGMKTTAIVTMEEVVDHLYNKPYKGKVIIDDELKKAIDAYYEIYGAK